MASLHSVILSKRTTGTLWLGFNLVVYFNLNEKDLSECITSSPFEAAQAGPVRHEACSLNWRQWSVVSYEARQLTYGHAQAVPPPRLLLLLLLLLKLGRTVD